MKLIDKIKSLFKVNTITYDTLCEMAKDLDLKVSSTTSYIAIRKLGVCKNIATLDFSLEKLQVEKSMLSEQEVEELCKKHHVQIVKVNKKECFEIEICKSDDLINIIKLILSK